MTATTSKLNALGYTDREADFLELVCACGGFWVTRQFQQVTGAKDGKATSKFVSRLQDRKHVSILGNGKNKVLCASPVLMEIVTGSKASIGKTSVHHLMTLDFALVETRKWFSGVDERVGWLQKNISGVCLVPRDERPCYLLKDGLGVVYAEPNVPDKKFTDFLARWLPGLASLRQSEVTFVTSLELSVEAAKDAFEAAAGGKLEGGLDLAGLKMEEFDERDRLEWLIANRIDDPSLGIKEMDRLIELRQSPYAGLYAIWEEAGPDQFERVARLQAERLATGAVAFNSCVVRQVYGGDD